MIAGAAVLSLMSCKSQKSAEASKPVVLENKDSVKVITREKTVLVHDTVTVEIPAQSAERTTTEGKSRLETDYAVSEAWINKDGSLGHLLRNKPREVSIDVLVPHKETVTSTAAVTAREVPVYVDKPVYIERELTKWQKLRLDVFWWLVAALAASVGYVFRNQIAYLVRKLLAKR